MCIRDSFQGVLDLFKRFLKLCLFILCVVIAIFLQGFLDIIFGRFQNFFILRLHIIRRNILRLLDVLGIDRLFSLVDLIK